MSFFGNLIVKNLIASKLKDVPPEQKEKIMKAFEENPQLFETIASEMALEVKNGKSELDAVAFIIEKHSDELRNVFQKEEK